jgi:hypothetical protein
MLPISSCVGQRFGNIVSSKLKEVIDLERDHNLPSAEHRGHIRRFRGLEFLTDEEDVALRGWVVWKRLNAALIAAVKKTCTNRPSGR